MSFRKVVFGLAVGWPCFVLAGLARRVKGPDRDPEYPSDVITYHELGRLLFRYGWAPVDLAPEWIEYAAPFGCVSFGWRSFEPSAVFLMHGGERVAVRPLEPTAAARLAYMLTGA